VTSVHVKNSGEALEEKVQAEIDRRFAIDQT
jgi:hypothetical protein